MINLREKSSSCASCIIESGFQVIRDRSGGGHGRHRVESATVMSPTIKVVQIRVNACRLPMIKRISESILARSRNYGCNIRFQIAVINIVSQRSDYQSSFKLTVCREK